MKYSIVAVKSQPFEIPTIPKPTFLDGKLLTTIFRYPNPENPKAYPLMIDWKYRVFNQQQHLFTYIAETKFFIEDDGVPVKNNELDMFIKNLYINVEIGWEEKTRATPLQSSTLPAMEGENLNHLRKQILDALK